MSLPLEGIIVLDLSRLLPGPYCSWLLADFGARVIKVEDTEAGDYLRDMAPLVDGLNPAFITLNRNKESIAVNLKQEQGREVFLKLVEKTDVLLEGFRPGVMDKLGLGYAALRQVNPGLIYCSLTGYGQHGPYRDLVGHDLNYISIAGILGLNAPDGGPPVVPGTQVGDIGGGALMAACAILMALVGRQKTGEGRYLDVAMLDGLISFLSIPAMEYLATGRVVQAGQSAVLGEFACYHIYETSDHRYLSLAALEEKFWAKFCRLLGKEEWIPLQFAGSPQKEAVISGVQEILGDRTRQEWLDFFAGAEVCLAPVNAVDEVFRDPQVAARELVMEAEHPVAGKFPQLASPLKLSGVQVSIRRPAPLQGENTAAILAELGYQPEEIALLLQQGLVKKAG